MKMSIMKKIYVGVAVVVACVVVGIVASLVGQSSYAQGVSAKVIAILADSNAQLITTTNPLHVRLAETIAGEDVLIDVLKVEQRYVFSNITTLGTTVVKNGAGHLHNVVINTGAAGGVIRCRDNTSDTGAIIFQVTQPATLLVSSVTLTYDVSFSIGLTCVTSVAAQDITIAYR